MSLSAMVPARTESVRRAAPNFRVPTVICAGDGSAMTALRRHLRQRGMLVLGAKPSHAAHLAAEVGADLVVASGPELGDLPLRIVEAGIVMALVHDGPDPIASWEADGVAAEANEDEGVDEGGAPPRRPSSVPEEARQLLLMLRPEDGPETWMASIEGRLERRDAGSVGIGDGDGDGTKGASGPRAQGTAIAGDGVAATGRAGIVPRGSRPSAPASSSSEWFTVGDDEASFRFLEDGGREDNTAVVAVSGMRILLISNDIGRADGLASQLRSAGANVAVADGAGCGLDRALALDPMAVVVDDQLELATQAAYPRLIEHPRLRWAGRLTVSFEAIRSDRHALPQLARLAERLVAHAAVERDITLRAEHEPTLNLRLKGIGPGCMLRALAASGRTLQIEVASADPVSGSPLTVLLGMAGELIVSADAYRPRHQTRAADHPGEREDAEGHATGLEALALFSRLTSGTVRVERCVRSPDANIMLPLDEAMADIVSWPDGPNGPPRPVREPTNGRGDRSGGPSPRGSADATADDEVSAAPRPGATHPREAGPRAAAPSDRPRRRVAHRPPMAAFPDEDATTMANLVAARRSFVVETTGRGDEATDGEVKTTPRSLVQGDLLQQLADAMDVPAGHGRTLQAPKDDEPRSPKDDEATLLHPRRKPPRRPPSDPGRAPSHPPAARAASHPPTIGAGLIRAPKSVPVPTPLPARPKVAVGVSSSVGTIKAISAAGIEAHGEPANPSREREPARVIAVERPTRMSVAPWIGLCLVIGAGIAGYLWEAGLLAAWAARMGL